MRRSSFVSSLALVVLALGATGAHAQEAAPLEVAGVTFTHADGSAAELFSFGEEIHAFLDLTNPGTEAVTNISATLAFPRGDVSGSTATFPDAEPGETVRNAEPFVFDYSAFFETGPLDDTGCFIVLEDGQVDEGDDSIVIEPDEDVDVVTATAGVDPSEPVEPPPPGMLVWTITSDQGSLTHEFGWAAVCSAATEGNGVLQNDTTTVPGRLATTGSSDLALVAIAGGLVILGARMRRRARGGHATRG